MKTRHPSIALAALLALVPWSASPGAVAAPEVAAAQEDPAHPANGLVEIDMVVGTGDWAVPAMLTLPPGDGPFPVAVLMHGFGPGTRDGDVGPNKIMRETAFGLARRGVAALRIAKRTTTHAQRFAAEGRHATVEEEWLDDAVSAVRMLRTTRAIDPSRVYVIGHSASGRLAVQVANLAGAAGAAIVNGSDRPAADMIEDQINYTATLTQDNSPQARAQHEEMARDVRRLRDPAEPDQAQVFGRPLWYWRSLAQVNLNDEARRLTARGGEIYVVHGERDYLTGERDWAALRQSLAGLRGLTLQRFPRLNHMMQEGEGKMTPAEYGWRRAVSGEWTDALAAWILTRGARESAQR